MIGYTLGIDVGFGKSPTGVALLWFPSWGVELVEALSLRPRCGGDWQARQYDVLVQLDEYLIEKMRSIPRDMLLIGYACAHLRERKEQEEQPIKRGRKERGGATHVLNPQTALTLSELCGGLRGLAVGHRVACLGVQETESKVALTSDSHATKEAMIKAALQEFGRQLTEHEADAVGHALASRAIWHRDQVVKHALRQEATS